MDKKIFISGKNIRAEAESLVETPTSIGLHALNFEPETQPWYGGGADGVIRIFAADALRAWDIGTAR